MASRVHIRREKVYALNRARAQTRSSDQNVRQTSVTKQASTTQTTRCTTHQHTQNKTQNEPTRHTPSAIKKNAKLSNNIRVSLTTNSKIATYQVRCMCARFFVHLLPDSKRRVNAAPSLSLFSTPDRPFRFQYLFVATARTTYAQGNKYK